MSAGMPTSTANGRGALRGFPALLLSGFTARGLGLVKLLLFAPLLGPSAFGAFRLATTASAILFAVGAAGLHTSFLRYLPELDGPARRRRFVARTLAASLALAAVVCALVVLLLPRLEALIFGADVEHTLMWLLVVSMPVLLLYQSGIGITRGLGLFAESAKGEVLQNVLHIVVAVGLIWWFGSSAAAAFGASLVGLAVAAAFLLNRSRRELAAPGGDANLPDGIARRVVRFSAFYGLIPAFQYMFDFMDRWALARFHGLEMAGVYSLVPIIAGGMTILGYGMAPVVARTCAEGTGQRDYAPVWSAVGLVVLGSMGYAVCMRIGEPILWLVAGEKWAAAQSTVPWMLAYFTWFNAYYVLGAIASVEEATWLHLVALCVGGAANMGLNLLWVPEHGMLGAAVATAIALLLTIAVHLVFLRTRRIAVPARFWGALAAGGAILIPGWFGVAATAVLGVWAVRGGWLLDENAHAELKRYVERGGGFLGRFRRA